MSNNPLVFGFDDPNEEHAYRAGFDAVTGKDKTEVMRWGRCDNCGTLVPNPGRDHDGRTICCAACVMHPLGCRCQFGEWGVAETFVDSEPAEPEHGPL